MPAQVCAGDGRLVLTGPSSNARRADTGNTQFYHDRCIAATTSNFLLHESKYGFAGAKSLCYIQLKSVFSTATKNIANIAA
jgi:hypothetical protein